MKTFISKTTLLVTSLLLASAALNAAEVTISGAGSVARLLTSKKADIETKSGQTLTIKSKNTLIGIKDLIGGDANLAIISGPDKAVYKYAGLADDMAASLKATVFHQDKLAFIVNPANPVSSLTKEQLISIFTGKTTNWKDVGGTDLAIRVLVVEKSNGFRLSADAALWGDDPLSGAQVSNKSSDVIPAVSHSPETISCIASTDVAPSVKVIGSPEIAIDMSFVSKGEPTAEEKAVIDAARSIFMK
jgi:phosphate transport system substrate-binding protein